MSAAPSEIVTMDEEQGRFAKSGKFVVGGGKKVAGVAMAWGKAFAAFISRGNVVDLAVGIVMGAAFTAVVNSLVADIIMPFIGLAGGSNFADLYVTLRGPNAQSCITLGVDCNNIHTIAQLASVGGISWNYGRFLQFVISFLITAAIVFLLVKAYTEVFLYVAPVLVAPKAEPVVKNCAKCTESIPQAALKCKYCTADQVAPEIMEHGKSA
ncbi:hypothetical protein SmJEL517_g00591 [Synchytrium microbalum]|uniref:Large conductance mechanosensitive channel protein n=1 Tax=Synchytrium microbalum TaxID=1806994 RepID=A0A507CDE9_9FUNG|nr:uncharacterized protein SmJEL517_g00591 [Synchytrium microbalum]TPX37642.1 hypothetical protein SmJEL517_g00591 [Synchytrium microbalum]